MNMHAGIAAKDRAKNRRSGGFFLALRFALRELRGGLTGFYVFLACIALGVAAISGINAVSRSINSAILDEGRTLLGGDIAISLVQREISAEQVSFLERYGQRADLVEMRSMARNVGGAETVNQTLIEIKAVDHAWPLYGDFVVNEKEFNAADLGTDKIAIEPLLGERLGVGIGDQLAIGAKTFTIAGFIDNEPDKLGGNFGFGPRVLMSRAGLVKAELIQPGSLVSYVYKIRLDDGSPDGLESFTQAVKKAYPDEGWRLRSRNNAVPALTRNINRFADFLTLVGLTALIVGGVGVANAVRAFLAGKREVIATLKSLGGSGGFVFNVYLAQILLLATIGIVIGLVAGALMPLLAMKALAGLLPLPQNFSLYPGALALGAVYGFLTALAFAIWPLAIARETSPSDLFRAQGGVLAQSWPKLRYVFALALVAVTLIALAVLLSQNRFVAIVFVGAIVFSFIVLRLVAYGIEKAMEKTMAALPHVKSTALRMAIANMHRPGSLTPSIVLSLGLSLSLLVALSLIDGNLRRQISDNLPDRAPDYFFVDIQNGEKTAFEALLKAASPEAKVFSVPMLRGRITHLTGIAAENYPATEGRWVLRGDRGITYSAHMPENSTLAAGKWWAADYGGEPLVSFSAEEAEELGLGIGDKITVNVLGRNISAKIASLRHVEWQSLAINFVMVFSPNAFAGAPHAHLATLSLPKADGTQDAQDGAMGEGEIIARISDKFPHVTSVRIKDALEMINQLIWQLAIAIRAAASLALIVSVLVLAGALAAGTAIRIHDAVVLKTLGATRFTLMRMMVYEYALLGLITALFALFAGGVAAWFVISQIMEFAYTFLPEVALITLLTTLFLILGLGLFSIWRILGKKPAPVFRQL